VPTFAIRTIRSLETTSATPMPHWFPQIGKKLLFLVWLNI
jgi:hypothetical protein